MIPAFRHMGGKARLRKWLVSLMPKCCNTYVEPFAGKGNVFYLAKSIIKATHWCLSDIDYRFLWALRWADLDRLPESVSKADFVYWKSRVGSSTAILIEPRVTFAGKGYRYGYSGSSGTHVGYSGKLYKEVCIAARRLLMDAVIKEQSWESALALLGVDDFVYLDPPYLGVGACYTNIDHVALVKALNDAPFRWLLSGYDNSLYASSLHYVHKVTHERNSEIKSSNRGVRTPVTETVWMNYELPAYSR